jgi:hypothetical protein
LDSYKINEKIKIIFYDDNLIYTKRVLYGIEKLHYDYILFIHEDWVITNNMNNNYINDLINVMKNNEILHVRSYKNHGVCCNNENIKINYNNVELINIPNDAEYFISLQPGIWDMGLFRELYMFHCIRPNILETISNSDYNLKKKL